MGVAASQFLAIEMVKKDEALDIATREERGYEFIATPC